MKPASSPGGPRPPALALVLGLSLGLGLGGALLGDHPGKDHPLAHALNSAGQILIPAAMAETPTPETRGTSFDISWHSVNAGGTVASGGDFQLRGSIGQPEASPAQPATSQSYSHRAGFWVVLATRGKGVVDRIFRDTFNQT